MAEPAKPASVIPPGMPYLRVRLEACDGAKVVALDGEPITICIPKELSLRVAKMHLQEYLAKQFKGEALTAALKAIGCK